MGSMIRSSNRPRLALGGEAMTLDLFAVYLGGRVPRCNTELHDVDFTVGSSI